MYQTTKPGKAPFSWLRRAATVLILLAMLVSALSYSGWAADALYILTGAENTAVVLRRDGRATALSHKLVYVDEEETAFEVVLTAGQTVTVRHNGEETVTDSRNERVSALLARLHIELTPLDMVQVDVSNPDGAVITVAPELTYYDKEVSEAPYATVRRPNELLPEGTEQVVQAGQNGERVCVYEVVWSNGELLSRQLVEEVSNTSVDEIIEYSIADSAYDQAVDAAARAAMAAQTARQYADAIQIDAAWDEAVKAAKAADEAAMAAEAANALRAAEAARAAEEAAQSSVDASKAARDAEAAKAAKEAEEARKAAEAAAAAKAAAKNSSLPMDKLVEVRKNGDGSGTLVFASGRTARYKYAKNMTATAYNKDEPGLGIWTASGTKVRKGVVAVDKRVIPLGTKMYVVANGYEYGYSVAEDTGVRGNVIDLYFESYKGMLNFGRRSCVCYILA